MKNVWLLIKVLFKQNYRIDKSSQRNKKVKGSIIASLIVIGCTFVPMIVFMLITYSKAAVESGVGREFISSIYFAEQMFALVFGTILLVNTLFFAKDNNFLATLPVTTRQLFFAKLLYVTFNELIYAGTLGIIATVIYGVIAKMSVAYYLLSVLAVILAPLLSIIVSSILLFPLMYVFSFIKKNATLMSLFSIGAYVIFMVVYVILVSKLQTIIEVDENVNQVVAVFVKLGQTLFFNYALSGVVFLSGNVLANLGIVIGVWGGSLIIAFLLSGKIYKRSMAIASESDSVAIKKTNFHSTNIMKSLIIKDWKEMTRDSSMLFYCFMQIIMSPLMIALIFGVMYKQMGIMDEEGVSSVLLHLMGTWMLFMFACGTNYVSSTSITRENNHWYLMKLFPIPLSLQVRAKFVLGYAFSVVSAVLGCIVLALFDFGILDSVLLAITLIVFSYGFVSRAIKIDIDRPRLNWTSVAEGMKNSPAMTTTMFLAMGIGVVVGILNMLGNILPEALNIPAWIVKVGANVVIIAFALVFALLQHKSLIENTDKLFDKLEG